MSIKEVNQTGISDPVNEVNGKLCTFREKNGQEVSGSRYLVLTELFGEGFMEENIKENEVVSVPLIKDNNKQEKKSSKGHLQTTNRVWELNLLGELKAIKIKK